MLNFEQINPGHQVGMQFQVLDTVDKVKVPRKVISAGEWRGVQVLFTTKSLGLRLLPT